MKDFVKGGLGRLFAYVAVGGAAAAVGYVAPDMISDFMERPESQMPSKMRIVHVIATLEPTIAAIGLGLFALWALQKLQSEPESPAPAKT